MKKSYKMLCLIIGFALVINSVSMPVFAEEASTVQKASGVDDGSNQGGTGDEDSNSNTKEPGSDDENNTDSNLPGTKDEDKDSSQSPSEDVNDDEEKLPEENENLTGGKSEEYISDLNITKKNANTVELTWTILKSEFSGYNIAVYSDEAMENQVGETKKIEDVSQTSYELTDLEQDTKYYIAVTPCINTNARSNQETEPLTGEVILPSAPKVNVQPGDAQVTLSWEKVPYATEYEIYDAKSGKMIRKVTGTSYTHTGLKNNTMYSYQVKAIVVDGENTYSSEFSVAVGATPTVQKPGKVKVSIAPYNKGAKLSWSKVSGATSYYVYRYNASKKKWIKVKSLSGTSFTDKGLTVNKTYKWRVSAVRTSGGGSVEGTASAQVSLKVKAYLTSAVQPMWFKGTIKRTSKAYTTSTSKKYVRKIKKGTRVTILSRGKKRTWVRLSNGKVYWVARGNVRFTSCIYTKKDYTSAVKTDFVNKKGYSSKTKYLIWISKYTQRVNIYKGSKGKWKLIRTCVVATGRLRNRTPSGVYKITYKEKGWFHRNTYEKPVVHFAGKASFHSRIYRNNGKLLDARIGQPVSGGCVRMYMSDVNYIYKYIPVGTTVVSY